MSAIIIDDNLLKIKMIEKYISKFISLHDVAKCGESALDFLETNTYQYIFLDHHLPDCYGSDLLEQIKTVHYKSKIISISNDTTVLTDYKQIGYDDVFVYPFDESIKRILAGTIQSNH